VTTTSTRLWRAANQILSLDDRGPILSHFGSPVRTEIRRDRELLFAISILLTSVEEMLAAAPPILKALRWYKLRMEVSAAELLRDIAAASIPKTPSELDLQRDVCRFLLSHGIHAVGTKFGRSETDLVLAEGGDVHVIETKLWDVPPSAADIERHLPQLTTYWDEFVPAPRTRTLVVFNRSDTVLIAPRELIADEFFLMFVNLLDESPSKRTKERRYGFVDGKLVMEESSLAPKALPQKPSAKPKRGTKSLARG
jgi:hypothetical protein